MADDMKKIVERLEALEKENQQLGAWKQAQEARMEEDSKDELFSRVSDVEAMEQRNRYAQEHPEPLILVNINAPYKESTRDKSGRVIGSRQVRPAFTGKTNCCPFCTDVKKTESMLDLTNAGRWACRSCGKHWYEESLGKAYSKALEKSFKGDSAEVQTLRILKDGMVQGGASNDRIAALEAQLNQLMLEKEHRNGNAKEIVK